ncbi:MAG: nitroreductase family protein, partial [Defluviitaleaceae bacterium]|nr:nitroreductase family protein [Defluviitaleaceae bacterium]
EQVKALLEAAMISPSACNTRPWEFIVVRDRAKLNAIKEAHPYAKMLETAGLAIVVMALPHTQVKPINVGYFPQDCAAATNSILMEAVSQGLGACWCGVYPKETRMAEINSILELDRGSVPFCVIAIGVSDETPEPRGFYDESKVRYI